MKLNFERLIHLVTGWCCAGVIVLAIGCQGKNEAENVPKIPARKIDVHCQLAVDSTDIVVRDHFVVSFQIPRHFREYEAISTITYKITQIGGFDDDRFSLILWEESKWKDVSDKGVFFGLPQIESYNPSSRWFNKRTRSYSAREFNLKANFLGVFMVKAVGNAHVFHKLIFGGVPEVVVQDVQITSAPIILTVRPVITDKGEVELEPNTTTLPE